jgi:hypothetical protein
MRAILKSALLVAAARVALWLLDDALTFTLYAPSAERVGGCYTRIEVWLDVTRHDNGIRQTELISGAGVIVTALSWVVMDGLRSVRNRRGAI